MILAQQSISKLYVFTTAYPFNGADRPFIEPQLPFLTQHFAEVVLVPYLVEGRSHPLPAGVSYETTYSDLRLGRFFSLSVWIGVLRDRDVYRELLRRPGQSINIIKHALISRATALWVRKINNPTLCYTMSLDAITLGLAKGRDQGVPIKVISRCIGGDVYEDQHDSLYIPFKRAVLESVDRIFPCSEVMTEYLANQHPRHAHKMETLRMGVPDPEFIATSSRDGVRRVVSCGAMIPLKRYDLLAQAMVKLASRQSEVCFEWRHIPLGPADDKIISMAKNGLPPNLEIFIEDESIPVMGTYQNTSAELFVHTSSSEGLPFVIMEALSCGLPVLATDVGGVSELVNSATGSLMPATIDAEKLTDCLWELLKDPEKLQTKKEAAKNCWKQRVNSDSNYAFFAERLASLVS